MDIIKQCEYLYNSLYIPIYLYNNDKEFITCFPAQETNTHPPQTYLSSLWDIDENLSYIETRAYTYYGYVKEKTRGIRIVIGPVHPLPYTKVILSMMHKDSMINRTKTEQFNNFIYNIPTLNLNTFINILLLVNFNVNDTQLSASDIKNFSYPVRHRCINTGYYQESIASIEESVLNNNFQTESKFLGYIETGNSEKLKTFFENSIYNNCDTGTTADNVLRRKKNSSLIGIALMARSAIKGGLSLSIAYQLSDVYLRQVEQLSEITAIDALFVHAAFDFTNRIAKSQIPTGTNKIIYTIIKHVKDNVYKSITVSNIAEYMSFNRSYLSRKFKNEFGIELSSYIKKCKLEEGKNLLNYSNMSISEISNLLCFSSQSHFQNAFKKQFGITPQQYRNTKN